MISEEFLRQIGTAFSEYVGRPSYIGLLILLLACVTWLAGSVVIRRTRASMTRRHELMALFQKLSDVNELSAWEKEMLLRIARWHRLENPSVLFVRKSLLKRYVESSPETGRRFDDLVKRANALMEKLYSPG